MLSRFSMAMTSFPWRLISTAAANLLSLSCVILSMSELVFSQILESASLLSKSVMIWSKRARSGSSGSSPSSLGWVFVSSLPPISAASTGASSPFPSYIFTNSFSTRIQIGPMFNVFSLRPVSLFTQSASSFPRVFFVFGRLLPIIEDKMSASPEWVSFQSSITSITASGLAFRRSSRGRRINFGSAFALFLVSALNPAP